MERVILESPYGSFNNIVIINKKISDRIFKLYGPYKINEIYGEFCLYDCLVNHEETPYASHLLYTRKYVLRDYIPKERKLGIKAGFYWRDVADKTIFYIDLGITNGMKLGIKDCKEKNKPYEIRKLTKNLYSKFLMEIGDLENV